MESKRKITFYVKNTKIDIVIKNLLWIENSNILLTNNKIDFRTKKRFLTVILKKSQPNWELHRQTSEVFCLIKKTLLGSKIEIYVQVEYLFWGKKTNVGSKI